MLNLDEAPDVPVSGPIMGPITRDLLEGTRGRLDGVGGDRGRCS